MNNLDSIYILDSLRAKFATLLDVVETSLILVFYFLLIRYSSPLVLPIGIRWWYRVLHQFNSIRSLFAYLDDLLFSASRSSSVNLAWIGSGGSYM